MLKTESTPPVQTNTDDDWLLNASQLEAKC